jgi:hypothetical protein
MAITTQAGLVTAMNNAAYGPYTHTSTTTNSGGTMTTFRLAGTPVGGATPTAPGNALDYTSAGAIFIPAPSGVTYIAGWSAVTPTLNQYFLCDRLVETGGLDTTVITAQTVNSTALPARNASGVGVELWLELYANIGASAIGTVTASYTNSAGTAGQTATLIGGMPGGPATTRTFQMVLAAGDVGVQSVQSVTFGSSSGTAGNVGVTLRQTLAWATAGSMSNGGAGFNLGYVESGLVICPDGACLEILLNPSAGTSGQMAGMVKTVQG